MKKLSLLALFMLSLSLSNAQAVSITFPFTITVEEVIISLSGVEVGDTFDGSITVEDTTPGSLGIEGFSLTGSEGDGLITDFTLPIADIVTFTFDDLLIGSSIGTTDSSSVFIFTLLAEAAPNSIGIFSDPLATSTFTQLDDLEYIVEEFNFATEFGSPVVVPIPAMLPAFLLVLGGMFGPGIRKRIFS